MNINKFELIGVGVSIAAMALALFLMRVESSVFSFSNAVPRDSQVASIVVADDDDDTTGVANAIVEASADNGRIDRLVVDDVQIGTGDAVAEGDTVVVHYIGTLQNGQQFDNSYLKGKPFEFTVGEQKVIEGWELGIVGMKAGGQRILVVPPELAYDRSGYGPIPGGATLVFAIELLEVK